MVKGHIASIFAPVLLVGFAGSHGQDIVRVANLAATASVSPLMPSGSQVQDPRRLQAAATFAPTRAVVGLPKALSFPVAERFAPAGTATAVKVTAALDPASSDLSSGPRDIAGRERREEMAIRSDMTVFGLGTRPQLTADSASFTIDPALITSVVPERVQLQPRADLLYGVPGEYAQIIEDVARQEGVDVNLLLSIMHAENAGFDPVAVSPAGAIGLMQLMPTTGQTFGAQDLTDPAQNIRAGAKFLKVLTRKYRNPVLIASAYNAGEPQVDVRTSLPLIRETADYVTKVVGLYTNSYTPARVAPSPRTDRVFASAGKSTIVPLKRRAEKVTRVSSSILVYSAGEDEKRDVEEIVEASSDPSGPVPIEKERQ